MDPLRPRDDLDNAIRMRLREGLSQALKSRDKIAISALRSALGAIGNAEAVDAPAASPAVSSPHVAGAVAGPGAGEAQRRPLNGGQVEEIVRAEISERHCAAREYEQAGHTGQAARLRGEAQVLMAVVLGEKQAGA
jgi:uncharacterized protein